MAVPTIPSAISLSAIQSEFGGSNPIAINEYYAGGSYVPSGTANATSVLIPSSGTISFANFSGAQAGISISLTVGDSLDINNTGEVGYRTSFYGSVSSTTLLGGRTLVAVYDYYYKGGTLTTEFAVSGNQTGSWWTSWQYTGDTYGTKTFNRSAATQTGGANGYYDGTNTVWVFNNSGNPTFDVSGTWTIFP